MSSKRKKSLDLIDGFGDDFEVSYEEETPFTYKLEPESQKRKKKSGIDLNVVNIHSDTIYDDSFHGIDDDYEDEDDDYDEDEYEDEEEDYIPHGHISRKKKRRVKMTPIAAPIKKSGRAVYNISYALLRNLSLILIIAIIAVMTVNFLRGSALYGDIAEELQTQVFSQKLMAYFAVAACLILYELLAALWTMSKARVRDEFGRHREDVGRGLLSFIFIYLCSYASFLISGHVPDLNEAVEGAKGALTVFGSMHNVLFGICAAGVVSCLLRKYRL